ncbi:metallophosphoesterase family protein [Yinghuangia seranimata]|uniref:metallophosphoesterase family protein n=1 Tax=Yinghuangia seranimata TaxID=408067 RepID=UPI00248BCF31|nr:DNA repair exonuclease [Yinghuangia seranimata]MDI2131966.1 DNA repair exonuclease [Yinghuangia seranimata]
MKLLHAADLHIDSPLRGLSRYPGAPEQEFRSAVRGALHNLVDLALDEAVDAVLLAGDVYDGDWKDYRTGLFFTAQMQRLREAGVKVCMVAGNHDAQSKITRELRLPDNVHRFSTAKPESVVYDDLGLAVHGQGFAERDITDNLAAAYPKALDGHLNIGLLHTALEGAEGHKTYAPCRVEDLTARGYDYWALGHIHARQEVRRGDPWIVFPGNLQGRHARETGPKGATLITADGPRLTVEHRDLDVVRWGHAEIDASRAADVESALGLAEEAMRAAVRDADGRPLALRVSFTGPSDAHEALWRDRERVENELRGAAGELDGLWIEKVRAATTHAVHEDGGTLSALVGDLRATASAVGADPAVLEGLVRGLPGLRGVGAVVDAEDVRVDDEEWRARIFDDAVDLLTALVGGDPAGIANRPGTPGEEGAA